MNAEWLYKILLKTAEVSGWTDLVIIGSQAIHGFTISSFQSLRSRCIAKKTSTSSTESSDSGWWIKVA
jgi:hypothetical protein